MGFWATTFCIASLATVYLNLWLLFTEGRRFAIPSLCAVMLLALWVVSNVLHLGLGDKGLNYYPPIDAVAGIAAAVMFALRPRYWSLIVMLCFAAMSVVHAGYGHEIMRHERFGGPLPDDDPYKLKLNVLFAGQLFAAALPGGIHVAVRVGDGLAGRPRRVHGLGLSNRRPDARNGRQGPA